MKKGQVLLITFILLMNVLFLLPLLVFTPVKAIDYGMDTDIGNVDASFWGEDADDRSGRSVAGVGDVNGDGYDDILIGAFGDDDGGNSAGQIYLIFGKSSSWAMDTDLSAADASFWGEDTDDSAGRSGITCAGDVNSDGYDDILIGVESNSNGGRGAGQTYLILGKASGWAMDTDLSNSDASFLGEDTQDRSGSSVAGAGDVNGDGYDDILIGASSDNDGGNDAGQTYLILGKSSGWAMDTDLSDADASFLGEDAGDYSGRSVAGIGDVNGDGYDDILVGADRDEDGGQSAGQTYLILGKPSGWAMDTDLSDSDASFWGENQGDYSGYSVAGAGDINDDGYDDILIGAFAWSGQTYLILGKASGWAMDTDLSASDASFLGEASGDNSGMSVAGAGDVNGDRYDDILIGANNNNEGGNQAGQTYLILGKGSSWAMDTDLSISDASFWGEDIYVNLGVSVAGGGDVNGDGYDDILTGAYGDDNGGDLSGQTYLIFPDHNSGPLSITSVKANSDDEYSHEIMSAEQGDKIYLELQGNDADATRKNIAQVWVKSSSNPNQQFRLRLHETGANTGKFRGNITIANRTHDRYQWINASEGGWVQITSRKDPTKFVNLTIGQGIDINPKPSTVYVHEDSIDFRLHFEASAIVPDSWSFNTNASWLAWNSGQKKIFGRPDNSDVGRYWVELLAEAVGARGIINFTIQVNNTAPSITIPNILSAHEAREYSVDYDCTDDGQGNVTWHLDTTATWLNLDTFFGILNGTPGSADVGIHTVNISVDDGNGGWDFTEYELEVIEINDPPELLSYKVIPNDIYRGQSSVIYIEASDPENGTEMNPPLLEAKSEISPWFNIDCPYNFAGDNFTGIFETNSSSEKEKYSFRVKLTDKFNISGNWHYFNDTLSVMNNPPVFNESFTNLTAYSDQTTIIGLASYGTDYEDSGSELTWEVEEYSPKALFDAYMKDKNRVEISPASADKTGLGKIKFKITDNDDDVNYKNITIEIINASARPDITIELSSPGNETIIPNSTTNLTWSVGDFDGKLSYDIYFGDSLSNMTRISENNDEQMFKVTDLQDATTYYWKVIAKVEEIPGIYESGIYNFEVQFGFIEEHRVEINFKVDSVEVERGDSVVVDLTLKNLGNVPEIINLDVIGDLADSVSNDDTVQLGVGENKTISVRIFGGLKMELKTYNLTIRASFNGVEHKVYLDVEVVEDTSSVTIDNRSKAWILYLIAVILFLTIIAILILVIRRSKKKKEEDAETIEAEIEGRSSGITKADLDILAIGDTPPAVAPFQGRLSYNLPGQQQQPYQHKPLAPAPKVTLPQLKVTGAVKEQPKALPQSTGVPPTQPVSTPVPTVALPQKPGEEKKTSEVPALPMVGSAPTVPITPSVTVIPPTPLVVPAPSEPAAPPPPSMEPPLPPPAPFAPDESGIKLSHDSVKNASTFRIDEPMPCSICYGEISGGLQAARCSCGNISHLSCGIKIGKCSDCGVDYQGMINTVSQEAIVKSVEDSQKTAKREVEVSVEWDEKGDMMRGLLKQLLNKEISVEQYQQISKDIKESF